MSTKPEAGQWWFYGSAGPGDSAHKSAVFIVGTDSSGRIIAEPCNSGVPVVFGSMPHQAYHEPRCTGWDWVVPEPAEDSREFLAGPKGVEVIGEDPDEWVIQKQVIPRNHVDQWKWVGHDERANDVHWSSMQGNFTRYKHGDEAHSKTLHVRCRRRDLPQPEPQPQKPVSDESLELIVHLRDQMQVLANRVAECERVVFAQKPQPQKTRVRLFRSNIDGVVICEEKNPGDDWQEIRNDADGFYVEDQQ